MLRSCIKSYLVVFCLFTILFLCTIDLQIAFSLFDRDGDGVISSKELQQVFQNLDFDLTSHQVQAMIQSVDTDGEKTSYAPKP